MASQVADASAEVSWEGRRQVSRLGAFLCARIVVRPSTHEVVVGRNAELEQVLTLRPVDKQAS